MQINLKLKMNIEEEEKKLEDQNNSLSNLNISKVNSTSIELNLAN